MSRILGIDGANPRVSGIFFKAVVQAVLIFGAETWVMTPCMVRTLGGSNTGYINRSQGGSPGGYLKRAGSIHLWRR